jgi:O-antigen/teichoic acid export membrane protein
MTTERITRNYLYNLLYQMLAIITPLITTPIVSRNLGVRNIGIYEYTMAVTQYFILFGCAGLNLYGQREIAYCRNNPQVRTKMFWELIILRFVMVTLSMVIFYGSMITFSQYSRYYRILLISVAASIFDISWLYQGMENFRITVMRGVIIKLLGIVLILVFVRSEHDLIIYYLCCVIPLVLGNISLWLSVKKLIHRPSINFNNSFRHLKPTLGMFLPQIAISVYALLDKTMIGLLVGTDAEAEVGYFSQSEKVIKVSLMIVTAMGGVMLPRIANLFTDGKEDQIIKLIQRSLRFVICLAVFMIVGLIGTSSGFVFWFFGNGYEKVASLICLISPIILLMGLSNVIGMQYLLPTKHQKEFIIAVICGVIVNFLLNLVLIVPLQSFGASIATIVAELSIVVAMLIFTRETIRVSYLLRISGKYVFSGVITFTAIWWLGQMLTTSPLAILFQVILGSSLYFGVLLLLRDELLLEVTKVLPKIKTEKRVV